MTSQVCQKLSNTQKGLHQLIYDLRRISQDYDMKVNVIKTNVMYIGYKGNCRMKMKIDGQLVEQISEV